MVNVFNNNNIIIKGNNEICDVDAFCLICKYKLKAFFGGETTTLAVFFAPRCRRKTAQIIFPQSLQSGICGGWYVVSISHRYWVCNKNANITIFTFFIKKMYIASRFDY